MADEKKPEEKKEEKKQEKPKAEDKLVVSKHSIKIKGKEIKYTVTTGTMVLKEERRERHRGGKRRLRSDQAKVQKEAGSLLAQ